MNIDQIDKHIFAEIGSNRRLKLYHDAIYKLCGLVIDFVDREGNDLQIFPKEHFWPFCRRLRFSGVKNYCKNCIRQCLRSAQLQKKEIIVQCHAGLHEMVLPLFDKNEQYIGAMITGQFQYEPNKNFEEAQIKAIAKEYKCNPDEQWFFYRHSPRLTILQLEAIKDIMQDMGSFVIERRNNLIFLEKSNAPERIGLIKQYVEENYMKELPIEDMARRFFLSKSQFSRIFKRDVGVSFVEYVNLLRCSKAKPLLNGSDMSVAEIAIYLGYGSNSQFYRCFKQINKVSPEQYRKKYKKG